MGFSNFHVHYGLFLGSSCDGIGHAEAELLLQLGAELAHRMREAQLISYGGFLK